jgi:hypothetical protein
MALYADRTTNQPIPFHRLRKLWLAAPMQEGVANAGDLKVSQRAAGANMSVDIATGDFWIRTDTDTPDGLIHGYSDAISNQTVTASHATLPRVDSVYVQYNDSSLGAGVGGDTPTFRVLAGTATTGAQITNFAGASYRAGAAAAPNDALLVADILVPAASTSVTNPNIVDRRPWARGASRVVFRTSGDTAAYSATSWGDIDATNLKPRIECSGVPLLISLKGMGVSATAGTHAFAYAIDGDLTGTTVSPRNRLLTTVVTTNYLIELSWIVAAPAAGSHLISPIERVFSAGSWTFQAGGANGGQIEFSIAEIIRPNASND